MLQWALAHREFNWAKVMFRDESRFCLIGDSPISIRSRKGEEYLPECLNSTGKHGCGGIMVCDCITNNGAGRLYKINVSVNVEHYLKYCAIPSLTHYLGDNEAIFQQDNAPCYTAGSVKSWMKRNNVRVLNWPGISPHLNPIEHVWTYIAKKSEWQAIKHNIELFEIVEEEWNSIPIDYISKLYQSMRRRIDAAIKAKGGTARY